MPSSPSSSTSPAITGSARPRCGSASGGAAAPARCAPAGRREASARPQTWPSTAPGTPVFVEYLGWSLVSGRMWWTAWATAMADSEKPVAMSLSLPSKVVMSPHAQTPSREVRITGSTTIAPLEISNPQSFSGPSAVLKPSWSRIASQGTATWSASSSEWKSVTCSTAPFPSTALIW